MAGKRKWSFQELESLQEKEVWEILAEIPSDTESLASDALSDDEEEFIPEDAIDMKQNEKNYDTVINDDYDSEDDLPLAKLAPVDATLQQKKIVWDKENFFEQPSSFSHPYGPTVEDSAETPVQIFECLFPEALVNDIVFQTNLYATQQTAQKGNKSFQPTTSDEMKTFLGINILMGIKKLPSLKDYWSSQESIRDFYISKQMSRDRFFWLLSNLHFADNSLQPKKGELNFDKLYKVRLLLDVITKTFKQFYSPGEFQAVDESMIKYKGRSCMKQYMPLKPTKRGYKVWVRADESGYICEFQLYTGKISDLPEKDLGARVVKDLTVELKAKNHRLFFDNYFTSVPLLLDLNKDQIYACGTLRKGKKYLPNDFIGDKALERGQSDWRMTEDKLICLKWKDRKPVYFLSNYHNPEEHTTINRRKKDGTLEAIDCPSLVQDYNKHMGFVDKADMLKKCYAIDRKSKKWYHRIVWHFLDTIVVNSYIIFQKRSTSSTLDLKQFRINVAEGLIGAGRVSQKKGRKSIEVVNRYKKVVSLEKRMDKAAHMPVYGTSRRCAVCSTKNETHRSRWSCSVCDVGLCLSDKRNCFFSYHRSN